MSFTNGGDLLNTVPIDCTTCWMVSCVFRLIVREMPDIMSERERERERERVFCELPLACLTGKSLHYAFNNVVNDLDALFDNFHHMQIFSFQIKFPRIYKSPLVLISRLKIKDSQEPLGQLLGDYIVFIFSVYFAIFKLWQKDYIGYEPILAHKNDYQIFEK